MDITEDLKIIESFIKDADLIRTMENETRFDMVAGRFLWDYEQRREITARFTSSAKLFVNSDIVELRHFVITQKLESWFKKIYSINGKRVNITGLRKYYNVLLSEVGSDGQ